MDSVKFARSVTLCFLVVLQLSVKTIGYEIPEVTIQAFSPKGFRASIPDTPGVGLFAFQGDVNKAIGKNEVGTLSGEVIQSTDGRWVFEDLNVVLKVGDVIHYYVYVSFGNAGFIRDNQSYIITELGNVPDKSKEKCKPTATIVRGSSATVCSGQVIFEDNFDTLKEDIWQVEQYIPLNHPEFPFLSYQRLSSDPTVSVANGNLRIVPKLQQNLPGFNNESIYSGSLDLFSGCTGVANECSAAAMGASILPPVASGRITSKGLAFTYGTVHVRAKLPQGDWIYPEILLEPLLKKYGNLNYASGVLKIAVARGNRELNIGITDFSNKVVYGGPVMDFTCRNYLMYEKKSTNGRLWGDDFHEYSITWAPDRISLLVDSVEWASINPAVNGLRGHFPGNCRDVPQDRLATGTSMAPFDDYFYLTLGVAAGGITEFRDDLITKGGHQKPWRNSERKASLNFWNDMDAWHPTWSQPEMLVDYVKVVAL